MYGFTGYLGAKSYWKCFVVCKIHVQLRFYPEFIRVLKSVLPSGASYLCFSRHWSRKDPSKGSSVTLLPLLPVSTSVYTTSVYTTCVYTTSVYTTNVYTTCVYTTSVYSSFVNQGALMQRARLPSAAPLCAQCCSRQIIWHVNII